MILLCLAVGLLAAFGATGVSLFLGAGLLGAVTAYVVGGTAGFAFALGFCLLRHHRQPEFAMTPRSV